MRRHRARIATAAVALVGALLVWVVSTTVFPYHSLNHDEGVYLQQAAMLLDGQLFMRPPVEDLFRPWFFVDAGERLYSKYAPVPAAMFALGELAGSYRLALPAVGAGILTLTAGVVSEVFDRRTGLLAAVFVLASPLFLLDAAVFLPYAPTALLNLAFAFAYLRADRQGDTRWAAVAGVAVGLAFFARPFTAVLFAAPFLMHASWSLRGLERPVLYRQATTAALGLAGVAVTLGYNAVVTGSAFTFPYAAFAPRDGLGFGTRRLLGHVVDYTPELAIRANGEILRLFFTEWVAGGILGTALAVVGLGVAVSRGVSARQATVAGLFASIAIGNVFFWGNYNLLGDLERAGDGLVAALGPYYHFDLLLPTAAFAASGAWAVFDAVRRRLDRRAPDPRWKRVGLATVVVFGVLTVGVLTVGAMDEPLEHNLETTRTYERAYEPFEGGPPADSLIMVPDPYGDWLNHPFQPLRNDPGFDGRAVYAIDDRPFALLDAFPNRTAYRYVYRGPWAPFAGSPRAARLQAVTSVEGEGVTLDASFGVPPGADGVTLRVATDAGSRYYVANGTGGTLDGHLGIRGETVRVTGDLLPGTSQNGTLPVDGHETIRLTAFVDFGPRGGFTYRLDLPVVADENRVRALTPRLEYCRGASTCSAQAAYIPAVAPDGVSVRTNLSVERND